MPENGEATEDCERTNFEMHAPTTRVTTGHIHIDPFCSWHDMRHLRLQDANTGSALVRREPPEVQTATLDDVDEVLQCEHEAHFL